MLHLSLFLLFGGGVATEGRDTTAPYGLTLTMG
jgi:hypothetical protein